MRGMKLFAAAIAVSVIAGPALAADLPSIKGPPAYIPPPPVFTWSGFYVGGQVGYQWGYSSSNVPGFDSATYNPNGVLGGAHVGYNYQVGQFVVGLEGDVNGSSYYGSGVSPLANSYGTDENLDGSVRARVGVAWDRALVYATGGAAFGSFQNTYTSASGTDSRYATRVGWTVGGGVEYAIDNNWSVRAEYRYTDFSSFSQYSPTALGATVSQRETDNRVQAGFSYKFDMFAPLAPVVARY